MGKLIQDPSRVVVLSLTTDASGAATVSTGTLWGKLERIYYEVGDLASTVDVTVTNKATTESIWAQSNVSANATKRPRILAQSAAGADLTDIYEPHILMGEAIQVVLAQGGNVKTGTITFYLTGV